MVLVVTWDVEVYDTTKRSNMLQVAIPYQIWSLASQVVNTMRLRRYFSVATASVCEHYFFKPACESIDLSDSTSVQFRCSDIPENTKTHLISIHHFYQLLRL